MSSLSYGCMCMAPESRGCLEMENLIEILKVWAKLNEYDKLYDLLSGTTTIKEVVEKEIPEQEQRLIEAEERLQRVIKLKDKVISEPFVSICELDIQKYKNRIAFAKAYLESLES
jgi:hypothetical protein